MTSRNKLFAIRHCVAKDRHRLCLLAKLPKHSIIIVQLRVGKLSIQNPSGPSPQTFNL